MGIDFDDLADLIISLFLDEGFICEEGTYKYLVSEIISILEDHI